MIWAVDGHRQTNRGALRGGAGADALGKLTIRNGVEPYPDCGMPEVNPLSDVPRANLSPVCKCLQPRREPTDAEDSTDGKGDFAFVQIRHRAVLYFGCPTAYPRNLG